LGNDDRRRAWGLIMSMDAMQGIGADPVNPFDVQSYIFTVVTPELETSTRFYGDILGYGVIGSGVLGAPLPTVAGAGEPGRRYALLRTEDDARAERDFLRLLEAPRGATANRPRDRARNVDGGLVGFQGTARHWDEAYRHLTGLGVMPISPPLSYGHRRITPLPDEPAPARTGSKSLSLYAPGGGEFLYLSCQVDPVSMEPVQTSPDAPPYGPIYAHIVGMRDRWPFFDFYETAFGLKSVMEGYAGREAINRLCACRAGRSSSMASWPICAWNGGRCASSGPRPLPYGRHRSTRRVWR
jgi:catechol 2,3-dioxygenase-like lactoylglutathione lyase family enzyme